MTLEEKELERLEAERLEAERLAKENDDSDALTEKEKARIQAGIDEALKPIKEKLDAAYKIRDDALAEKEAIAKERREAEVARLREEGKFKEAHEIELAEERKKREALERENITLKRDNTLTSQLSSLDFRNERSSEMAYRDIVEQLVQNEQGVWVHRSGVSIADFVKTFASDEDNSFLFKTKVNSGGGSGKPLPKGNTKSDESIFNLSQEEVIKRATARAASR